MIVETQSLTTIGVGAQKTQTEPGDAALRIPNLVLPNLELMEPTVIFPAISSDQLSSFTTSLFLSRTNLPSTSFNIVQLSKGLWRFFIDYNIKQTFAAVIPFNTKENNIRIISPLGGVSMDLLTIMPIQSGYFTKQASIRLLLRDSGQLVISVPATGVTDFWDAAVNVVAEKLL